MAEVLIIPTEHTERRIYFIREQKVMLDSELASLYESETKYLVRAVKRNPERFPEDFAFQLPDQEVDALRCQIGTSKPGRGGRRYNPWTFTEHGILMHSSVLRSNRAAQVNVQIMRSFVRLREMAASHEYLIQRPDDLEERYDKNFREVFTTLKERIETPPNKKNSIGFRGK
ncbi:MAG: ORF6N domain-containing protein [Bdellovibrionales bacterium]|nr:ORF6N domain-containing protein [Bdellovibrionales bacterium]